MVRTFFIRSILMKNVLTMTFIPEDIFPFNLYIFSIVGIIDAFLLQETINETSENSPE